LVWVDYRSEQRKAGEMQIVLRIIGVVLIALTLNACITDSTRSRAVLKLESAWKATNDVTVAKEGTRFFRVSKAQGFEAAQLAVNRIGMVIENQSYETGFLLVTAPAPVPLTMSEWAHIQKSDTAEMRRLLGEVIGVFSWWATLDPSGKEVLANLLVNEKYDGINVSVNLRLRARSSTSDRLKRLQPPPTAVHMGLAKFWSAFEKELEKVVGTEPSSQTKRSTAETASRPAPLEDVTISTVTQSGGHPEDTIVVIIGNKNYPNQLPDVDYAHNDAEAIRHFLVEELKVKEDNIIHLRDATLAQMENILGNARTPKGKLWRWVRPGESDVMVYYSGHGIPGMKDGREYLLPVDGNPDSPEIHGYPLDLLYKNLEKIDARSVTVVLDACFSGDSPNGPLLKDMSGVRLKVKQTKDVPFTVMAAAQPNQVASWDNNAQLGLFTKHLLDALSGAADSSQYGNADNQLTLGEIQAYLDREMTYAARRYYGREQFATVFGEPDKVIVRLEE
jgi:hypothetical protein